MKGAHRTLTLRALLLGQFAFVMLLTVIFLLLIMLIWRLPLAREQQRSEQLRTSTVIVQQVHSRLHGVEQHTLALARLQQRASGPPHVHPSARALAQQLVRYTYTFQTVYWLDTYGRVLHLERTLRLPALPPLLDVGTDLSRIHPAFHAASRTQPLWSGQYLSPSTNTPVVALALALPGLGYLMAEISVQQLAHTPALQSDTTTKVLYITDRKGQLILAPDAQSVLLQRNISNFEPIARALIAHKAHGQIDFDGMLSEGYALPIQPLGWTVFAGRPLHIAHAAEQAAITLTAVVVALAVGSGLLINWLVASILGRHLRRSVAYANAVARGNYQHHPSHSRIEEVHQLETSLGAMGDEIRRREQQLRAIIDLGPNIAIQIYDRDTRVCDWNPASERMLGYSKEQALGRRPLDLFYDAQQQAMFERALQQIEASGLPYGPFESDLRQPDGQTRWVYSTLFPIPGTHADELLFVGMDVDITEIKYLTSQLLELNDELENRVQTRTRSLERANAELTHTLNELRATQERLLQADKLAALGSLVAGVAHELNTPIGNALMAISTLQERQRRFLQSVAAGLRRSELDAFVEQVGTAQEIALRNLERAADLITSFKQVAVDQTSSQRRRFELSEVVHEIVLTLQPVLKRSPHQLEVEVAPGIWVDSYPGPLGQVLSNLIQNALLHGLEGMPAGKVQISAKASAEHFSLSVRDNGRGIPCELQDRIFEPFFTTRLGQGGSGLGLHIVHNLVVGVLGGRLELDSSPGQGACFTLNCPLQAPCESPASPAAPALAA